MFRCVRPLNPRTQRNTTQLVTSNALPGLRSDRDRSGRRTAPCSRCAIENLNALRWRNSHTLTIPPAAGDRASKLSRRLLASPSVIHTRYASHSQRPTLRKSNIHCAVTVPRQPSRRQIAVTPSAAPLAHLNSNVHSAESRSLYSLQLVLKCALIARRGVHDFHTRVSHCSAARGKARTLPKGDPSLRAILLAFPCSRKVTCVPCAWCARAFWRLYALLCCSSVSGR